jgi:hypothetical protein
MAEPLESSGIPIKKQDAIVLEFSIEKFTDEVF